MKLHTVDFPPLACSLDTSLGDYYQDLGPAISFFESAHHGRLDDHGVPLVRYGKQGSFHNAIHASQYALANLRALRLGEHARVDRAKTQLDWLLEAQQQVGKLAGCWVMQHDDPKYPWLKAPWTSALASGLAISALLRGWEWFGEERYRVAAERSYSALHRPRTEMVLCRERGEELWYEEYPAERSLHVLNGHVYALLGVVDIARVTGDPEAGDRWRRAAATLRDHLEEFDLGFWSAYDLRWREPVSLHYHKNIHVPLLRILARLDDAATFDVAADRWQRYAESAVCRLRLEVELRLHRWRKEKPSARTRQTFAFTNVRGHDSGRSEALSPADVSLRPFPYPFRAALAICNDPDSLTAESFRRLHRFLMSDEETEWGPGLGLDIGGAFFMFRSPDSPNSFTVFDRLTNHITADGEFIVECARRGILDVLHTYGCFTDPGHFTRGLAETALEALTSYGVNIETWTNHGPSTNTQCIGTLHGQGDLPGAPGYHADLTVGYGVRWFWTGAEITDRVALDAAQPAARFAHARSLANTRTRANPLSLVETHRLRDGRQVRRFYRYGALGPRTPVLEDLPRQLSDRALNALVEAAGYAIVYQHLAVRRVRPGYGPSAYAPVDPKWFAAPELAALRRLSERFHAGELWVAPTTHLLRYREQHHGLSWTARRERDRRVIVIRLDAPADPARDLAGITFYCDRPESTDIQLESDGELIEVAECRRNPPDLTGRPSITLFPLRKPPPLP